MKYNLTQYSQTISNTSEGNISLSTDEIIGIINAEAIPSVLIPVSGTLSGTLVLDSDLGSRLHVDEIRYHFDSLVVSSTVASGIKFSYKKESFETYTSLSTYYNDDYYYAPVSGTEDFRYVRVEHTLVSGVSGYLQGFYVLNDDTYVDFGEDGTDTNHNVNLSVENNILEINELQVFNSGPVRANAKVIIEPQNTAVDDVLSISDSADGPWYGVYRNEDKITGPDMWPTGAMDDLGVTTDILKLSSGASIGTYTTRIIELDEDQRLTFNTMNFSYPSVYPAIEFYDDFTSGLVSWEVITGAMDHNAGYLRHTNDNNKSRTKEYYDYSDNWQITYRFIQNGRGSYSDQVRIRPIYSISGGTDVELYMRTYSPTANQLTFYVSGSAKHNNTKYNWYNIVGTWINVKIQREFDYIRYKVWTESDPEPSSWDWEGTGSSVTSIVTSAQFEFYTRYSNGTGTGLDDIVITKNFFADSNRASIIATDAEDTTEIIEVKSSNSRPMDRENYMYLFCNNLTGTGTAVVYPKYYWIADGSFAEQGLSWSQNGVRAVFSECWYDSIREDEYWVDKPTRTNTSGSYCRCYFRIRRKDGALFSVLLYSTYYFATTVNYNTYKLTFDQSGGFWIYYFIEVTGSQASQLQPPTYYLDHYNSSMSRTYRRTSSEAQGTFLYDMDSVYESAGDLWYTDNELSTVFKIDKTGTILASYLAVDTVRGVMALADGGCWFIQQQALIRLDSSGVLVDQIDLSSSTVSYLYSDLHDGFWLHDGHIIRHLNPDGSERFNIEIPNLYWITVIDSGVITKQHDGSTSTPPTASYVSKYYRGILRTWDYPRSEGGYKGTWDANRLGVRSQTYDDLMDDHASNFPISIDNQWNVSAEWRKVSLKDYNFTIEQYHQIRFTLRADNSANSPEVYGLWGQRAIEIPNINPGNYGKFYLKSDIADLDTQDTGNYTSKIRAYWFLNTE